jgi:O-glycosyl hydrolase
LTCTHSLTACRRFLAFCGSSYLLLLLTVNPSTSLAANVVADGSVRFQRMDGFGSSERVFDDPHVFDNFNPATGRAATTLTLAQQDAVLDRLYVDLKLTRVRPASPDTAVGAGIEAINDNNDPNVTNLNQFNFDWKRLDAHVDYMARARQRGADTFFLSPLGRESWMGVSTANDAAEYSEWLLAQVRRSAMQGVVLPYLSVANEPSYTRNAMSGAFMRDVIKNLGPRLRAEGYPTLFVAPDDVRASNGASAAAVILADPIARQYVGALATHLYDESITNVGQMKSLAQQYDLPLWMTEFTMGAMGTAGLSQDPFAWASLTHDLIATYDVSAVDYLWGFFGEWEGNQTTLISLNNTGAVYDGYTLNKTYYTTGQFSRFIEPGSERIKSQTDVASLKTSAYLSEQSLVIVAINTDHASLPVDFDLSSLGEPIEVIPIRTSPTENWAALPAITVADSSFAAVLAANSITTFVAALPTFLAGDFNEDRVIDAADLSLWGAGFGAASGASHRDGDADADGDVDGGDFLVWQRQLGLAIVRPASKLIDRAVPEPRSVCLLWLAMAAWRDRRRGHVS